MIGEAGGLLLGHARDSPEPSSTLRARRRRNLFDVTCRSAPCARCSCFPASTMIAPMVRCYHLSCCSRLLESRAFVRLRRASHFLFAWPKRKITKEKGHPTWRLPGFLPGKSVSRGRAFRQHIRVLAKRNRHRADSRCAACRPHLTAAQGPRVEQRAILARTRCATALRLREQTPLRQLRILYWGSCPLSARSRRSRLLQSW